MINPEREDQGNPNEPPDYFDDLYFLLANRKTDDVERFLQALALRPGSRVLDLGGGFGRLARQFARRGHDVTVVDISAEVQALGLRYMAQETEEVRSMVCFHQADMGKPLDDLPLNWFGVGVCAHNSINHLRDSLQGFFGNLAEHLEEGGMVLIDALPEKPYHHYGSVEFLESFEDNDARWIVTTTVAPDSAVERGHRLFFFYEQFKSGQMVQRFVRFTDRRVWTTDEIEGEARRNGFFRRRGAESDGLIVLEKMSSRERSIR